MGLTQEAPSMVPDTGEVFCALTIVTATIVTTMTACPGPGRAGCRPLCLHWRPHPSHHKAQGFTDGPHSCPSKA